MKHEPVKDHAERKRIFALIERCGKEQTMSRWIDADEYLNMIKPRGISNEVWEECEAYKSIKSMPSIDICFCKECKHRPVKEDADGENYGFNLIKPNDGDERCPCLVDDGWYSWMPKDDFFCGYGERRDE